MKVRIRSESFRKELFLEALGDAGQYMVSAKGFSPVVFDASSIGHAVELAIVNSAKMKRAVTPSSVNTARSDRMREWHRLRNEAMKHLEPVADEE